MDVPPPPPPPRRSGRESNGGITATVAPLSQDWKSFTLQFHKFDKLSIRYNDCVESPEFQCFGLRWVVRILPWGVPLESGASSGDIVLTLRCLSDPRDGIFNVRWHISHPIRTGKAFTGSPTFHLDLTRARGTTWRQFADYRSIVMREGGALFNGTFTIEISMKRDEPNVFPSFVPPNPLCNNMLELFMDEKMADVLFEVGGEPGRKTRKRAKTLPSGVYAHRFILQRCAPLLAELCEDSRDLSPVPITDVKRDVFCLMLYYVYGGKIPDDDLNDNARDLIHASDVFGVVNLKLEAETAYVRSDTITTENVMEKLLYADAKNCALLKEAAMDFLIEHCEEGFDEVNLENVPASMFKELLAATARKKRESSAESNDSYASMRISDLRKKLHEKGLDIDGSRETMIATLKENRRSVS